MTAKGKINASKLEAGMRIIVEVLESGAIRESSRKTGENVRIVKVETKHFRAAQGPYERRGKYVIGTSLGQFEAATIQTMFLAPEDAAGIKRAHVEALAENAEREIAQKEAEQATPAYRHFAEAVRTGGSYRMALEVLHAEARAIEDANKAPEIGDTVVRHGMHAAYTVKDISAANIILWSLGTSAVAGVTPSSFRQFFYISGSESWRSRTERCLNDWHETAPARAKMLCPECPGPE